jgi:hypothetical protein
MNNAVFGNTMENLRKRLIVELVSNQSKTRNLTSKFSFHAFRIFNNDLVAVHMLKQHLYLNRSIYVGFTILDVSNTLMYDFHAMSCQTDMVVIGVMLNDALFY